MPLSLLQGEWGGERLQVCVDRYENGAQNRIFILDSDDVSMLGQIYADICKHKVTDGFSERSAVLLVKPLSDKHPTAIQESSLACHDNFCAIGCRTRPGSPCPGGREVTDPDCARS